MRTASGLLLALALGGTTQASAQALSEKLCIVGAAQKLPSIPGLSITDSTFSPLSAEDGAKAIASSFNDVAVGADLLNRTFALMEAKDLDDLRYEYRRVAQERILASALQPLISGAGSVELNISAAGQMLTMHYVCIWRDGGQVFTASMGASD